MSGSEPDTEKQVRWQRLLKHPSIARGIELGIVYEWRPDGGYFNAGPAPGSLFIYMADSKDKILHLLALCMDGTYETWFIPPPGKDGRIRDGKSVSDEKFIAECKRRIKEVNK